MHIAAALVPISVKRVILRIQQLGGPRHVRAMDRFGETNDCTCGGLAIIGGQGDVALVIVKRRYSCNIVFAALYLFALHRLGCLAQRRAGEARLSFVDLGARSFQRLIDDGTEIRVGLPASDFFFVDVDCVADRLLHTFKIERSVACDLSGHFVDEAFRDLAFVRFLFCICPDKQIENARGFEMIGKINWSREIEARIAFHFPQALDIEKF
jgi:hypothetical protein